MLRPEERTVECKECSWGAGHGVVEVEVMEVLVGGEESVCNYDFSI